jgi:hypothetical protein
MLLSIQYLLITTICQWGFFKLHCGKYVPGSARISMDQPPLISLDQPGSAWISLQSACNQPAISLHQLAISLQSAWISLDQAAISMDQPGSAPG